MPEIPTPPSWHPDAQAARSIPAFEKTQQAHLRGTTEPGRTPLTAGCSDAPRECGRLNRPALTILSMRSGRWRHRRDLFLCWDMLQVLLYSSCEDGKVVAHCPLGGAGVVRGDRLGKAAVRRV